MCTTVVACATRRTGQPRPEHSSAIRAPFGAVTVSSEMFAPLLVRTPRTRTSGYGLIIWGRFSVAPRTTPGTDDREVSWLGSGCAVGWTAGDGWIWPAG